MAPGDHHDQERGRGRGSRRVARGAGRKRGELFRRDQSGQVPEASASGFVKTRMKSSHVGTVLRARELLEREERLVRRLQSILVPGRVLEVFPGGFWAATAQGRLECRVPRRLEQLFRRDRNFVVAGDQVLVAPDQEHRRHLLVKIEPRRNSLARWDNFDGRTQHHLGANIDLVLITISLADPEPRWGLLDRMAGSCLARELPFLLLANKADLFPLSPAFWEAFLADPARPGGREDEWEEFCRHLDWSWSGCERQGWERHREFLLSPYYAELQHYEEFWERLPEDLRPEPRGTRAWEEACELDPALGRVRSFWVTACALLAYRRLGWPLRVISALTGQGLEAVRQAVHGRVAMLAGHSGVGKSLVVNRIDPESCQEVGNVSWKKERGSHTTTIARLLPFAGGYLLDTPGVRSFAPILEMGRGPGDFYQEWHTLPAPCRFNDCRHEREPGCAVKEGLRAGKLSWLRYRNYCQQLGGER